MPSNRIAWDSSSTPWLRAPPALVVKTMPQPAAGALRRLHILPVDAIDVAIELEHAAEQRALAPASYDHTVSDL